MKEELTIERIFRKVGKEKKSYKKPIMPKIKKDSSSVRNTLQKQEIKNNSVEKQKNTKVSHSESIINVIKIEEPQKNSNNLGSSNTNLDGGTF